MANVQVLKTRRLSLRSTREKSMRPTLIAFLAALMFGTLANAGELTGTASYRERIALPPEATFRAILYDISNNGQIEIGRFEAPGDAGPPYAFAIAYDEAAVVADGLYAIKTEVTWPDRAYVAAGGILDGFPAIPSEIDLVMMRPGLSPASGSDASNVETVRDMRASVSGLTLPSNFDGAEVPLTGHSTGNGGVAMRPAIDAPDRHMIVVERFLRASSDATSEPQTTNAALRNTYWRLDTLNGAAIPKVDGRREPHLFLDANEAETYRATVGCNHMRGSYTLKDDTLAFSPFLSTMMACPAPLDQLERDFGAMLAEVERFDVTGETLVLRDNNGEPRAMFTAVYF